MNCVCPDYVALRTEHCSPGNHYVSICKLRHLLDERISSDCYEQHLFHLDEYLKACRNGFFVNDLPHLTRVFERITEKLETVPIFKSYLKKLLDLSSIPPLLHTHGEELTEVDHVSEYLSVLGFLAIWLMQKKLRERVYYALLQLITIDRKECKFSASLKLRHKSTELSLLPEIIVQLIEFVHVNEYIQILKLTLALTEVSITVCQKMVKVEAINYLLIRLLPEQKETELRNFIPTQDFIQMLDLTCTILLNLMRSLKGLKSNELEKLVPSKNSIWALRYVFRICLLGKNAQLYRNNLMEFILLCLDIFPYINLTNSNLSDDLAYLSVATEINTKFKSVTFTNDEYDACFKKMCLICLCFVEKDPTLRLIYEIAPIMHGLLKLISVTNEHIWHPDDYLVITKYALSALYYVAPYLIDQFIDFNGTVSLLVLIETYMTTPNVCNQEKVEAALKIFMKLIQTKNKKLIENIRKHYGISVFTLLCTKTIKKPILTSMDQRYLAHSFSILEVLCSEKPLPVVTVITHLLQYFHRVIKPNPNDTCINPRTVICALHLLWNVILNDNDKRVLFIKNDGVYLLLDIIQNSSLPVQVVGLGCLVDLCEDDLSVPYLLTWRGGNDKKQIFLALLAEIFNDECKKIGTPLNSNNIITNISYPLMGKIQFEKVTFTKEDLNSNGSLIDLFGSVRPKIYALIQLLKTRHVEKAKLINEHYKISNLKISTQNQITLHLAENFLALKLSEAWNELNETLIKSNIKPIDSDAKILHLICERMSNWNRNVKQEQENILNTKTQKEMIEEMDLYRTLRKCRASEAIDALREMKYLASTTDRMFMLEQKRKQRQEIEATVHNEYDDGSVLIRTYKNDLNVTAIFHQNYNTEYNVSNEN